MPAGPTGFCVPIYYYGKRTQEQYRCLFVKYVVKLTNCYAKKTDGREIRSAYHTNSDVQIPEIKPYLMSEPPSPLLKFLLRFTNF